VNKIGVKWALVIGAATFPIQGSAYYCNSKFGNQWVSSKDLLKNLSRNSPRILTGPSSGSTSFLVVPSVALEQPAGMWPRREPL
jgi:hypothetical protein